ncbi:MAG: AI-2E family transporter [Xenococcus sp. (in: cyanobacteria)]
MSQPPFKVSLVNFVIAITLGLLLVLLWQLRSLIVVLMIAVVIAATLAPIIQTAHKLGIPRWLSVLLVYLSLIATLSGVGVIIGPTVVEQIQRLIRKLPVYLESLRSLLEEIALRMSMGEAENVNFIRQFFDIQGVTGWVIRSSQELAIRSFDVTKGFIGGVLGSLLALLLSGYMLSGSDKLLRDIVNLFPAPWNERLLAQVQPVSKRMGGYIQGRILVSAILAIAISIGLKFLGLSELALGLGVIAGFTNLIPFFGPVIGAIPALIVAIAQGGLTFFGVLLLFVIIQNVETYLLDPLLVGTSVKVPPLYQLLAVLGGAQLLGIIGALIVPPWVAGTAVLLENLYVKPKLQAENNPEFEA